MANTDGKEIKFNDFMQKMLSDFACSEGHIIAEGRNDNKAAFLKFLHDNLGKLQDYIRKYDIVIVEKAGTVVFFPTRLLNEDKKDELIKQCKEDLKKFGWVLPAETATDDDKTKTNNDSDNNKSGDMFSVTFKNLNLLDFWGIGEKDINVNIEAQGWRKYISKGNLLDKVTNKTQEDLGKKSENTFNIICTNNHDGLVPSPHGTEHRGKRQGKLIKEILSRLFKISVDKKKHVNVNFLGASYGNAMKNYLYPELHELFQKYESEKDVLGDYYVKGYYNIDVPYLPLETPSTLGRDGIFSNITRHPLPKNLFLKVIHSSKIIDPLHPTWFTEEVEETLMNNPNTRDNMPDVVKVKYFCKEIPKTYDKVNPFFTKRDNYICRFSNGLKETDNCDVASLDRDKLDSALYSELVVLRYLMEKHKNSRARVFYDSIFVPTLNKFIEKYGYEKGYIANNKADASDKKTQELKEYIDIIDKDSDNINSLALGYKLYEFACGNNSNIQPVAILKKGAEILKYVIDAHRHKRGIRFTYVYDHIIEWFKLRAASNQKARINSESLGKPQISPCA